MLEIEKALTMKKKRKILVADSEKNTREAVAEIFSQAGYLVSSARSGSETIDMLTRENYDLIFCDLDMPLKPGLEIIRMARALNQKAKIIVTSSSGSATIRNRLKKEGAFDYLDKPLRKAILLAAAEAAFGRKSSRRKAVASSRND